MAIARRISRKEFREALGIGDTWFTKLVREGHIPPGTANPGGHSQYWSEAAVNATVLRLLGDQPTESPKPRNARSIAAYRRHREARYQRIRDTDPELAEILGLND